jgi:hypothetical protein
MMISIANGLGKWADRPRKADKGPLPKQVPAVAVKRLQWSRPFKGKKCTYLNSLTKKSGG